MVISVDIAKEWRMKYNPKNKKHIEKIFEFTLKAYADERTYLRILKNIAYKNGWDITYQERIDSLKG